MMYETPQFGGKSALPPNSVQLSSALKIGTLVCILQYNIDIGSLNLGPSEPWVLLFFRQNKSLTYSSQLPSINPFKTYIPTRTGVDDSTSSRVVLFIIILFLLASSHLLSSAFFSLSFLVVTQVRGHKAGYPFSLRLTTIIALHCFREKTSTLFCLVD